MICRARALPGARRRRFLLSRRLGQPPQPLIIFGGSLILRGGPEPEKLMARRRLLALAILLVLALAAHAQERKPEPEASKALLDTERVRGIEMRVKPAANFELKGH